MISKKKQKKTMIGIQSVMSGSVLAVLTLTEDCDVSNATM